MMKFFRHHQKMILGFMAVLMVLFLVPTLTYNRLGGGPNQERGQFTLDGKAQKVYVNDVNDSFAEVQVLSQLSPNLRQKMGNYVGAFNQEQGGVAWLLWNKLAEQYHVTATEADRVAFVADPDNHLSDEVINKLRDKSNNTIDQIYRAIDHMVAVEKMTALARSQGTVVPSYIMERELRNVTEKAMVDLAAPNMTRFGKLADPRTASNELPKLFKDSTDRKTSDKLAVEIMLVDATGTVTDAQAKAYYREHQADYMEPAPTPTTQPAGQSGPTTRPASASAVTQPGVKVGAATQPAAVASTQPAMQPRPLDADLIREIKDKILQTPTTQAETAAMTPAEKIAASQPESPIERINKSLAKKAELVIKNNIASYQAAFSQPDPDWRTVAPQIIAGRYSALAINEGDPLDQAVQLMKNSHPLGWRGPGLMPSVLTLALNSQALRGKDAPVALQVNQQVPAVFQLGETKTYFIWRLTGVEPGYAVKSPADVKPEDVADFVAAGQAEQALEDVAERVKGGLALSDAVDQVNVALAARARELAGKPAAAGPATRPASQPGSTSPADEFLRIVRRVPLAREQVIVNEQLADAYFWQMARSTPGYQKLVQMMPNGEAGRAQIERIPGLKDMLIQTDKQAQYAYSLATSYARQLAPGSPPEDFPSAKVLSGAFELVAQSQNKGVALEKAAQVLADPDRAVLVLLQVKELAGPSDAELDEARDFVGQRLKTTFEQQFAKDWFNIFERLKFQRTERKG